MAARPGGPGSGSTRGGSAAGDPPAPDTPAPDTPATLEERARQAGLRLVSPEALSLRRQRRGRGFSYHDEAGRAVTDDRVLARVRALAIPPAYREVRIAPQADGHIQAVGRDEAGRLQYLYHPRWEDVREAQKVEHLAALCAALPAIRGRIARGLRRPEPDREKALAAIVALIDRTHIRVGCSDYVHLGRSRGAATLLKRHVEVEGSRIRLDFRGKHRLPVQCALHAPALARALEELRALRGSRMFKYRDAQGRIRKVEAAEVNRWLQEVSDAPVTAKDFRTLAATATAGERLAGVAPDPRVTHRRRQIAAVMAEVAGMLGNTPAVARRSYVHRRLVEAFESGGLQRLHAGLRPVRGLSRGECLVAALFAPQTLPDEARAGDG